MRADRLVSILMLLQSRGRTSARELAETLDVSMRTIYRDIDALCAAGIPLYAEHGAEGGYALLEEYHTELTGLTEDEARILVMLAAPGPLESLEVGQTLKAALRKVYAALPRYAELYAAPRLYLDWTGWERTNLPAGRLETLYQAVRRNLKARIVYRMFSDVEIELVVDPLGLVAKAGVWYLACSSNGKLRWQRVADLLRVELTDVPADIPAGFDVRDCWAQACAEKEALAGRFKTLVRAAPAVAARLAAQAGDQAGPPLGTVDPQGWHHLELRYDSLERARQALLAYGGGVEVLAPPELRLSIADFAQQIAALYR